MDEKNSAVNEKMNGERRQSQQCVTSSDALNEIKKFKENLLQSVSHGGEPVISDLIAEPPLRSRSRSASRARDALVVPSSVLADMDENKLFELKEAFLLFDMDGDGCIDHSDLRAILVSLGEKVDDQAVAGMLSEAPNPLDFEGFVNLLGYRTLELDSEETMVQALSRWDYDGNGYISEERLRHDLMTWGDRFTKKETDYALDEAPVIQKGSVIMIDYVKFCNKLCGLRKRNKNDK